MRRKYTHNTLIIIASLAFFISMAAHYAIAEGLTGYYYHRAKKTGPVVAGPPDQVVIDKTINFATSTWNWQPFGWQEHFSVYWTGWIYISGSGPITFSTFADDGSWVYIDNQNVVENNRGRQEPSWSSGRIDLTPGYHKLEITYYNWKDSGGMGLYWDTGAGGQIISTDVLFPESFQP